MKDILNYRYFQKRALYLSVVARHLLKKRKSLAIKSIHFSSNNPILPTLVLTLEGVSMPQLFVSYRVCMSFENEKIYFKCIIVFSFTGSKVAVVLHTSISDDEYFKRSKLTPDHNNVRRYYLSQLPNQSDDVQNSSIEFQDSSDDPPTPHYNASLLLELGGRERHLVTLYSALHNSPGLIDAVLLCKVWARQRGLDEVLCSAVSCFFSFCLLWWLQLLELKLHVLHWAMNFTIILVY